MGFFDNLLKTVSGANKKAEERAAEHAEYVAEIAANGEKPCKKYLILYGTYNAEIPLLFITEQAMWIPGHPETAILSKNGVENKTYRFKTEYHISSGLPKTVTKEASVVKRAVVGGVVAGGAGAVVGAISAADANAKGGVQKKVHTGSTHEWYTVNNLQEGQGGYQPQIRKILCFDTDKSLPEEVRKALREGDYETLAITSTFDPFVYKGRKGSAKYNWPRYAPGEERKYKGLTAYDVHWLDTKEDAQNVITFIDKFAKGEETGQLLEEYRIEEDDYRDFFWSSFQDNEWYNRGKLDLLKKYAEWNGD